MEIGGYDGNEPDAGIHFPASGGGLSAEFDFAVADVVLGLSENGALLLLRLHVRADSGTQAFQKIGLLGLFEPAFDLHVVGLPLFLILHFAQHEFAFKLLARQVFDPLQQVWIRLHEGVQSGIHFGIDFELAGQLFFLFG